MPYEFLDDIAIADIAFRVQEETLEELFKTAGDAVMNTMIDNLEAIEPQEERTFAIENDALDLLLFNFLDEFLFYKDSEQLLLRAKQVTVEKNSDSYSLTAITGGEVLDPDRHHQRVDVKAITLHRFQLEQIKDGWTALVILDI